MGKIVLRLHQVDLRLVIVIVVLDVRFRNGYLRAIFLIAQLVDGDFVPQLLFEFFFCESQVFDLLFELFLAVGRFGLIELGIHLVIGRHNAQLFRLLQVKLNVDDGAQNIQPRRLLFLHHGFL